MITTNITFNRNLNEYRVCLFINYVYQAGSDYFTDELQDANDTAAAAMIKDTVVPDKTGRVTLADGSGC